MQTCPTCGSHAINPGQNGRLKGVNEHLCDVCYWKAERTGPSKERLLALADEMLVLGSPRSSKELLDMAERFGV